MVNVFPFQRFFLRPFPPERSLLLATLPLFLPPFFPGDGIDPLPYIPLNSLFSPRCEPRFFSAHWVTRASYLPVPQTSSCQNPQMVNASPRFPRFSMIQYFLYPLRFLSARFLFSAQRLWLNRRCTPFPYLYLFLPSFRSVEGASAQWPFSFSELSISLVSSSPELTDMVVSPDIPPLGAREAGVGSFLSDPSPPLPPFSRSSPGDRFSSPIVSHPPSSCIGESPRSLLGQPLRRIGHGTKSGLLPSRFFLFLSSRQTPFFLKKIFGIRFPEIYLAFSSSLAALYVESVFRLTLGLLLHCFILVSPLFSSRRFRGAPALPFYRTLAFSLPYYHLHIFFLQPSSSQRSVFFLIVPRETRGFSHSVLPVLHFFPIHRVSPVIP